jgi:hypothetical protein
MPRRFCNKCEARRFYYCLVYTFPSKSVCVSKWTLPHVRFWKEDCFSLFPCLLQRKGRWRVADITRQNCPLLLERSWFFGKASWSWYIYSCSGVGKENKTRNITKTAQPIGFACSIILLPIDSCSLRIMPSLLKLPIGKGIAANNHKTMMTS